MAMARALRPASPPVLGKILPVAVSLATLGYLVYGLTEGSPNLRFIQLGAVLGLLAYVATFVDIILGLSFLLACIGLSPEMALGGVDNLRIEDFILPGLLVAWLTRAAQRREPWIPTGLGGPCAAYFLTLLAASLLGIAAGTTTLRAAALILIKYVEYFLMFAIVVHNVRTEGEFRALVVFAVLVALTSLTMGTTGEIAGTGVARVHGPAGETATIYGGYLLLTISILLGLAIDGPGGPSRLLALAAAALLAWGLLFTYSRTSYAALFLGVLAFSVLKARRLLPLLGLLLVMFPALAPGPVWERAQTIAGVVSGSSPASWDSRVHAWHAALARMGPEHFLLGRGVGSTALGELDNEYIRVLVDAGLLGLGFFLWILVRLGRAAAATRRALPRGTFARGYAAGFLIGLFAMLVHAVGATSFTSIRTMESLMCWTGLLVALSYRRAEWGLTLPEPGRPALPRHFPFR
jgi:hypothetical protein